MAERNPDNEYEVTFTLHAPRDRNRWTDVEDSTHVGYVVTGPDAGAAEVPRLTFPSSATFEVVNEPEDVLPVGTVVSFATQAAREAGNIAPFHVKISNGPSAWRWVSGYGAVTESVHQTDQAVTGHPDATVVYRSNAKQHDETVEWRISFTVSSEYPADSRTGQWASWGADRQRLDPAGPDPYVIVPGDAEIKRVKVLTDGLYLVRESSDDPYVLHRRVRGLSGGTVWQVHQNYSGEWYGSGIIADAVERDLDVKRIGDLPLDVTHYND